MIPYLERNIKFIILGRVSFKFDQRQFDIISNPESGLSYLVLTKNGVYILILNQDCSGGAVYF